MVDPLHLNLHPILLLLMFPHNVAEAQSATQPAPPLPPPTMWDFSAIVVMVGALIATFLVVAVFSMFLRRCAQSYLTHTEWPCTCSQGNIPSEVLRTFPILSYSSITHLRGETTEPLQCAICLTDFTLHDNLRLLPHCNHVFHPPCIDAWLSSHRTCPVCRANLLLPHHVVISVNDDQGSPSPRERESKGKVMRSNSTGHSLVEEGACVERYTLRLPDDVRRSILVMQRSASYNAVGTSMKGFCWSDSEGSSRGKRNGVGKNLG